MDPRSTGIAIHEWLTVAGIAALFAHLLLSWKWIVEVTRRFLSKLTTKARINYILNIALFIDMTLIMFTGLMISEVVLPSFGISLGQNFVWRRLHSITADLFVPLLGLHAGLHWSWIVNTIKRYIIQPIFKRRSLPQQAGDKGVQA
jgi:hypothetical protein